VARPRTRSDDEIFEAVGQALGEYGPAALTLGHIASQVELTAPALIRRFGSKASLLQAFARREAERAWVAPAPGRTSIERLLEAALEGIDALGDRHRFPNHLDMLGLDLRDPVLSEAARTHARGRVHVIAEVLKACVADGSLAPHDLARQARLLHALVQGSVLSWIIDGTGPVTAWVQGDVDAAIAPLRRDKARS
jgi:AcrR family transcriptional regulator